MVKPEHSRLRVEDSDAGKRLDRFLADRLSGMGRRKARQLILTGQVSLSSKVGVKAPKAAPSLLVTPGLEVNVVLSVEVVTPVPEMGLEVLLETPHLVAVNKPASASTLPRSSADELTMVHALLALYPECQGVGGPRDHGFVHRLDQGTSGILIAARDQASWDRLRSIITQGGLSKRYLAMVKGEPPREGVVESPLIPEAGSRRRVTVASEPSRAPVRSTRFQVQRRKPGYALLEVEVSRAYRHQIRVHLASQGYPIVGDKLYGIGENAAFADASTLADHATFASRHALHASYAAFAGDEKLLPFEVRSALPADLEDFWDLLPA